MNTMIQNFTVKGGPQFGRENLPKLRRALREDGLDGLLVPHEDAYQNEYLPDCNERLMWVSGFTGSAGAAIVLQDTAAIFIDGRYTIQARTQVDASLFEHQKLQQAEMENWLKKNVKSGQVIGADPRLHSPDNLAKFKAVLESRGASLQSLTHNPIDAVWTDRPPAPVTPLRVQPLEYAGESHAEKRARIAADIRDLGGDAAIITAPASIAWLLNIRGHDVQCTPLPLSTAILRDDGQVDLFINPKKVTREAHQHLGNQVTLRPEADLDQALDMLAGQKVVIDPASSSAWYFDKLQSAGAKAISALDPVALPKACKNKAEIHGTMEAHKRDAIAIVKFLHWLDTEAQNGQYDEIQAAEKLERFRHESPLLRDLSFETISSAGPNGALPHYRVNTDTVLGIKPGSLYLVDSGGQYEDGTTDITRTVPIGTPTDDMKTHFTLVLKGHIALARARFPEGTTGSNLDALARYALWQHGLDYDHGTGHGVGVYLGVHEGPQRISKMPNKIALRPGMIISNEPGYYRDGEYGIRIENLQYVTEPKSIEGGDQPMMGFQYLTLAPIHRGLIRTELLTRTELVWLNNYHSDVLVALWPHVEGEVKEWLSAACAPI